MLKVITTINSHGESSEQNHGSYTLSKEQEALTYYSSRRSEQNYAGLALELVNRALAPSSISLDWNSVKCFDCSPHSSTALFCSEALCTSAAAVGPLSCPPTTSQSLLVRLGWAWLAAEALCLSSDVLSLVCSCSDSSEPLAKAFSSKEEPE